MTICSFLLTSLTVEARNKRESAALSALWVARSTHIVLLPMNVILGKECEESNSPTHRKRAGTFLNNYDVIERKLKLLLIHSTVQKRVKRFPDTTVETTT